MNDRNREFTGKVSDLESKVSLLLEENHNVQTSLGLANEHSKTADANMSALTTQVGNQSDLLLEKSENMLQLERKFPDLSGRYD